MKICYTLATTDLDGGSRSLLNLLDHCVENSIEPIVVLTRKHNELQRILKDKNINYKIIRHGIDNFDTNIIKTLIKIILNEIAKFRIYYLIKKEKIDILHNNSLVSLIGMKAARMAHIPYICHIRELLKEGLNVKMLSYKDVQKCIKYSYCTICISKYVENYYKNYLIDKRNYTFFDGLNIQDYDIAEKNFSKNKKNILFIGRYFPNKGQMQALEALNILVKKYRMKDLKLKFIGGIGDMEYYNSLLQYCSNNNLNNNVVFEDFSLDLREERKRHGIALVCSIYEAMGRVTPEAMLANQLVIGANFGGTKEIIENKYNGYLYELNNPDDLADKIYNAIKNEKVSSEIIDNAYKYAKKNFDNNIQNEKVVCIYNKIMKERVTKKNE